MVKEEPSYMMFARAAIRNRESLPYSAVERLVSRIDQLENESARATKEA